MSILNNYSAYNLQVQSELTLPFYPTINTKPIQENAISIHYGRVDDKGLASPEQQGYTYQVTKTKFWLNVPSVGRFLVANGQNITIDPAESADNDSIQAFLLNTCMEVLLRQRQLIVTQGYALKCGTNGVAILGGAGLGQAMLQGLFYKRGYSFLTGNFVALSKQGEVLPGTTQLEFWPQVVSALKLESEVEKTLRPKINKYIIPLDKQYHSSPLPLNLIYILKTHQQHEVQFSKFIESDKLPYLYQLSAINHLPVHLWYEHNNLIPYPNIYHKIQMVTVHLPMAGLKLQEVADAIVNDVIERGHHHASL